MSTDGPYELGWKDGYEFASEYTGDLEDLKPLEQMSPEVRVEVIELLSDFAANSGTYLSWAGFRAGLVSYLVDQGITASPPAA